MKLDKLKTLIVLFKAQTSLEKNVKKSLLKTELSINEFTVMEALYTKERLSTQQLIDSILIPNSSLTYVLDVLEKKGYLAREKDAKDKRRQYLALTSLGQKIFKEIYKLHYQHMNAIFECLTKEEQYQLEELLKRVGKEAEAHLQ